MRSDPSKPKRRWYQFSMRTLIVLLVVGSIPLVVSHYLPLRFAWLATGAVVGSLVSYRFTHREGAGKFWATVLGAVIGGYCMIAIDIRGEQLLREWRLVVSVVIGGAVFVWIGVRMQRARENRARGGGG